MVAEVFGKEHITYALISTAVSVAALLLIKKYARSERARYISLHALAFLLLCAIMTNRLSQVFRYDTVRWYCIIPDSFCGMTSLVIALGVLFGKRDNAVLHFAWLSGIFGGIATVVYPSFVGQGPTIFYLPTISGLLHHSLCATVVVALLMLGWIRIDWHKWWCVVLGFTAYVTVGAFLMATFGVSDAFHIVEPLLPGTPLTVWVMALIYLPAHALLFLIVELVRRRMARSAKTAGATVAAA